MSKRKAKKKAPIKVVSMPKEMAEDKVKVVGDEFKDLTGAGRKVLESRIKELEGLVVKGANAIGEYQKKEKSNQGLINSLNARLDFYVKMSSKDLIKLAWFKWVRKK